MSIVSPTSLLPVPVTGAYPVTIRDATAKNDLEASAQSQVPAVPPSDPMPSEPQELAALDSPTAPLPVAASLQASVANDGGLAQIMADLLQAQQTPGLPAQVQAAIVQVLAFSSPIDAELTASDVKAGLMNSGLFSEANAAAILRTTPAGMQAPLLGTDIKTALLVLRQVLKTWLAGAAAPAKDAAPQPSRSPAISLTSPSFRGGPSSGVQSPIAPVPTAEGQAIDLATVAKRAESGAMPLDTKIVSPSETTSVLAAATPNIRPSTQPPEPGPANPGAPPRDVRSSIPPAPSAAVQAMDAATVAKTAQSGALLPDTEIVSPSETTSVLTGSTADVRASATALSGTQILTVQTGPPATTLKTAPSENSEQTQAPVAAEDGVQQPSQPSTAAPAASYRTPTGNQAPAAIMSTATEDGPQHAESDGGDATTAPTHAGAQSLPPGSDIKAGLWMLQVLKTSIAIASTQPRALAVANDVAQEPLRSPAKGVPPPYRGGPTSSQRYLSSSLPAGADLRSVKDVLTKSTDAALSHVKLLQIASLPAPQNPQLDQNQGSQWMFEIPFTTPHGRVIAQFQISRDSESGPTDQSGPVWRARFSIDVEPMGPVHAQVALMGERAWVTLWAEREASLQTLRSEEALLSKSLKDSNLAAEIAFCVGAPRPRAAATGRFLDSAS